MQEVFRCDECGLEFPNEAKAQAHQQRNPLTECEAVAIAAGVDKGMIQPAGNWQGPAGCFSQR